MTPVDIGRMPIACVVLQVLGDVGAGIESLMADKHTLPEGAPRELFGRLQTSRMEETSLAVNDIGASVEYGRQVVGRCLVELAVMCNLLERIILREEVARVHIDDVIA